MDERGTGRTTKQMEAAPFGAIFMVQTRGEHDYSQRLSRFLERGDLIIVTPDWLETGRWLGLKRTTSIVRDHALRLNERQEAICREIEKFVGQSPQR